jgi:hydroxybutyrate-dimer hydrolase
MNLGFCPREVVVMKKVCLLVVAAVCLLLMGCQADQASESAPEQPSVPAPDQSVPSDWRVTEHRDGDDLVTAGLGLAGLMAGPPSAGDPAAPGPAELRRLAIHNAYNSLSLLSPAGGIGGLFQDPGAVPGREFAVFHTLEGRRHPARFLVQLPDAFDHESPCLVVAPASGSRGVYGAIPLAGPWALTAGCAVVYTDKGAGTDFFDFSDHSGVALSGVRVSTGSQPLGLEPEPGPEDSTVVGMPHAHSGDHPEADWGRYVLAAVHFGLDVLNASLDGDFSPANTRIIATGLSNGGGAVLRAAEQDSNGLLDAVVAVMPNITAHDVAPLYDYATLAALYQPCMLADLEATMAMPLGNPVLAAAGQQRCASLAAAGMLPESDPGLARERLLEAGFDSRALTLAATNVALDLWRSVGVAYASAYLGRGPFDMPCGYAMQAGAATVEQRQSWWATHSGVGAGGGVELVDGLAEGRDPALPGLMCLRELWLGEDDTAVALRAAVEATRGTVQLPRIPVLVVHGLDDGLVPAALTSRPYVDQARDLGATLAYWEVENAQHFDVLLHAPGVADRLVPILPYGWAGLDHVMAVLDGELELSEDRVFKTTPAPTGQPLEWSNLGL